MRWRLKSPARLFTCSFRHRSKITSKLRVNELWQWTQLCTVYCEDVHGSEFSSSLKHARRIVALRWCHSECHGVWNRQHLGRLFRRTSKKKISASLAFVRETTGDQWFPSQRASNTANVSIWRRHHDLLMLIFSTDRCWQWLATWRESKMLTESWIRSSINLESYMCW